MTKEIKHQICGDGFIQYRPVKTPRRPFDDDDIQEYTRPWRGLTDDELLQAYGWRIASGAPNYLLEEAKQELLGALRKVEAKLKERNHG